MVDIRLLSDAVTALEMLTKGLAPDSLHALAGGFGLDCLSYEKALGKRLSNERAKAAQGLFQVSRGETWKLETTDRNRLNDLAATIREIIESTSCQQHATLH